MKRDSMLLFINVALGLSLGSGITAYSNSTIHVDLANKLTTLLFLTFVLNVVRHFLGFVKFYDDETLRDPSLVGNIHEVRVTLLKGIDFSIVLTTTIFLYFMGNVVSRAHLFSHYLFLDSTLFLLRNLMLCGSIPKLATNTKQTREFRWWLVWDSIFWGVSVVLMYVSSQTQLTLHDFVFVSVTILILITIADLIVGAPYYFE